MRMAGLLHRCEQILHGPGDLPPGVTREDIVKLSDQLRAPSNPTVPSIDAARALLISQPTADPARSVIAYEVETATGTTRTQAPISADGLADRPNSEVLQKKAIKRSLGASNDAPPATIAVSPHGPIDPKLVIRCSRPCDFPFTPLSDPSQVQYNLLRLSKRLPSSRVRVFDFSPRDAAALTGMRLDRAGLPHWQQTSKDIQGMYGADGGMSFRNGDSYSIDSLFEAIDQSRGEGAVVILYGHCDGSNIILHSQRGVERLNPEVIRRQLAARDPAHVPSIVLLSCEAGNAPARAFLDGGAPMVCATDQKIPIDKVVDFMKAIQQNIFQKNQDVIDSVFEAIKTHGPERMGSLVENACGPRGRLRGLVRRTFGRSLGGEVYSRR